MVEDLAGTGTENAVIKVVIPLRVGLPVTVVIRVTVGAIRCLPGSTSKYEQNIAAIAAIATTCHSVSFRQMQSAAIFTWAGEPFFRLLISIQNSSKTVRICTDNQIF
jgi:hypothetical protein